MNISSAQVDKQSDTPLTEEDIQLRIERENRLNRLGMSMYVIDDSSEAEDLDKLKARILIMQDKEVPAELEEKIIRNNLKQQRKQEKQQAKLEEKARKKQEKRNARLLRNGKTPRDN